MIIRKIIKAIGDFLLVLVTILLIIFGLLKLVVWDLWENIDWGKPRTIHMPIYSWLKPKPKITQYIEMGEYLAVYIGPKGCQDSKILIYDENVTVEEIVKSYVSMDLDGKHKSPIARFEPTEQGWIYALKFCQYLVSQKLEVGF